MLDCVVNVIPFSILLEIYCFPLIVYEAESISNSKGASGSGGTLSFLHAAKKSKAIASVVNF